MIYENLKKSSYIKEIVPNFTFTFLNGAKVEINSTTDKEYIVKFFNHKTNKFIYQGILKGNMWASPSIQYFIKWRVEIWDKEKNKKIKEHIFNAKDKKVYIHLGSKAVGDSIAWIPYVEEFRKAHNCEVICSTFHNKWFSTLYSNIKFIPPGTVVNDLYAMYEIGWYYDKEEYFNFNRHPFDHKHYPLQKTASDILGLTYKEIKTKLHFDLKPNIIKGKYVVIAPHASSHAKYWNYPQGWQILIDWLNNNGYKVVMATYETLGDEFHDSKLGGTLTGVINKTGCNFDEAFSLIKNSKAFIGVSSGLSWASWALNTPTIMISGFTENFMEPAKIHRISTPEGFCMGCQTTNKLDPGDWEWCPFHKGTNRQFECTKSISPSYIIENLTKILKIK